VTGAFRHYTVTSVYSEHVAVMSSLSCTIGGLVPQVRLKVHKKE
jgi:hypothetical protein